MNYIGCGLGLRPTYINEILEGQSKSDWFEVITENLFTLPGFGRGQFFKKVLKVRESYPLALHGVSLNIGSSDPLSSAYITELKNLIQIIEPCWVSDHLCWTGVSGINLHDLLPLPYTLETIHHVVAKIEKVQNVIQQPLVLENVSSYFDYKASEMSEWEFISEITKRSGCRLLLDVNNVFVSAYNQGFNAEDFFRTIPAAMVQQIHLAGPSDMGTHMIDTHDTPIRDDVWIYYEKFINMVGPQNTLIERDGRFPTLLEIETEVLRAKSICKGVKLRNGGLRDSEISI